MGFMPQLFEHKYLGEHYRAARWLFIAFLIQGLITWALMILSFPISYLYQYNFDLARLHDPQVVFYFERIRATLGFHVIIAYGQYAMAFITGQTQSIIPLIPLMSILPVESWLRGIDPWDIFSTPSAFSKWADEKKIKAMKLWNGSIIVLCRWKKRYLRFEETLSALAFAPPGTGKTVGIVVPTIFNCDSVSMIINDPKPELCYITSGYRAQLGPVFTLNWGKQDDPDTDTYYPSWNPLSPGTIPPEGPSRDMYVDSMVNVFVQDPQGSSADPHWTKTGRNALSGFINYIVSKCEKANASDYFYNRLVAGKFDVNDAAALEEYYMDMNDSYAGGALTILREGKLTKDNFVPVGTWSDIPERWVGHEACIPMLLDWMNEAQVHIAEDVRKRKEGGDQMASLADPMKELLESAVMECRRYGYSHRAILELTQLASTPDKERGSILSTALTGISIFKNAAVRQRTSHSDFTFRDLRGMIDPADGKMKPVTVYLSVNLADARALNVLTGVFIELMTNYLISYPPNSVINDRTGEKIGPSSVLFVLDEFPQMPKLDAIIDGPAVGRGQKVSYLLICQDLAQIEALYGGPNAVETLMSTTAAKILLTQNNEKTAKRFSDIIGSAGDVHFTYPENTILAAFADEKREAKTGAEKKPLLSESSITMMKPDQQVVIMQGYARHPIKGESPRYYKDPEMLAKSKIPSAPAIPEWVRIKNEKLREPTVRRRKAA